MVIGEPNIYQNLGGFTRMRDFTWRVSDCEGLVGVTYRRCGGRLWKIVKRDNLSRSYIFNWCSVRYFTILYFSEDALLSRRGPFLKGGFLGAFGLLNVI